MIFSERVSARYLAVNRCSRQVHPRDRGSYRPKGRRDYHILYITRGCCYLEEQGEEWTAAAGNLILYRPGEAQHYWFRGRDGSVSFYVHFSGTGCEELLDRLALKERITRVGESPVLQGLFEQMTEAFFGSGPFCDDQCAALLYEFLVMAGQEAAAGGGTDRILDICRRMQTDFAENHPIREYAELCGLSESRFSHRFRERIGQSPKSYLLELRVKKGCSLLSSTDLPVAEVAEAVGIRDVNYFSRLIRSHTGLSPTKFRQML